MRLVLRLCREITRLYHPLTLANAKMEGKDKIAIKSMTRTTMSFLNNMLKRTQNPGPGSTNTLVS